MRKQNGKQQEVLGEIDNLESNRYIDSGVIAWVFTKNWQITTGVTALFHAIRVVLYYFHERLRTQVDWGLKNKTELTDKKKKKMMERLRRLGYLD